MRCCSAGFQRESLYRHERGRWRQLARVARATFVFADFEDAAPDGRLSRVPLAEDAPMRAEWLVGCDAPGLSVVLSAWELPGQDHVADRDRRFDSLWTLEPAPVRDACLASLRVAAAAGVGTAALVERLASDPALQPTWTRPGDGPGPPCPHLCGWKLQDLNN